MKLKLVPYYELAPLQAACYPDMELRARGGIATAGYQWIARIEPSVSTGIDKQTAWYVEWCGRVLAMYQRCLDNNPGLVQHPLHLVYVSESAEDPDVEYAHLVGMYKGFRVAVRRRFYDALVMEGDTLVAVQAGMGRKVLISRLRTVMAAVGEAVLADNTPVHEDPTNQLVNADTYWQAK